MHMKVKLVESIEDLKEAGYEFLLEDYPFSDIKGLWFPLTDEYAQRGTILGEAKVTIGVIVHGRLYPEKATIVRIDDEWYISEEEFEKYL